MRTDLVIKMKRLAIKVVLMFKCISKALNCDYENAFFGGTCVHTYYQYKMKH